MALVERKSSVSLEQWDTDVGSGIDVHGLFLGTEGIPEGQTALTGHELVVPLEEKQEGDRYPGRLFT